MLRSRLPLLLPKPLQLLLPLLQLLLLLEQFLLLLQLLLLQLLRTPVDAAAAKSNAHTE